MLKKHFVTFLSPGTFLNEETVIPVDSWDVKKAVKMSKKIVERHGATPFAFYFTTRGRRVNDLNSKEVKRSTVYYLGGKVMTLAEVKKKMPNKLILIRNMECNGWDKIIINDNSWRVIQPLCVGDIVLTPG